MPTLSASDYTQYLKFKAAAASPIRPAIQTRDNATLSQSVLNANVLASQAAFVVTPASTTITTSSATVTGALTSVINAAAYAGSSGIEYTTVQPHGLTTGDTITIAGLVQNTLNVDPNATGAVTVTGTSTFVIVVSGVTSGAASGSGRIVNRVYYTTNAAHGLLVGDSATVTGITTFSVSGATVLAVPNLTTFILQSTTTGLAVTGQSGVLTFPRSFNQSVAVRGLARVIAPQVVQTRSNPEALSTVSWTSGTSGSVSSTTSSKFQRPGGLPAKNVVGTYTRLPQNAGW